MRHLSAFYQQDGCVLGTRAREDQYLAVKEVLPQVQYDPLSHILVIEKENAAKEGCVAVCTGGTSDIPGGRGGSQDRRVFGAKWSVFTR